ncbi:hypothetical protein O6H91_02G095000 [Diphasiastrum complanatum]|uniref:Uncharacterized protein n=1 Tax=Diphasiastrum complanatum TaxID=34168 RepID=A0ACC2EI29_DIPCM|nr:hypothetical protein O6H91_02G095000 [Diphasiastrum complanatum]
MGSEPINYFLSSFNPIGMSLSKVPGLRKDSDDARASSFLQLLDILPQMSAPPTHILVENVVGFEFSSTHERLVEILHSEGFATQEFILSPLQFGIPYSRPRYFFLAKRRPLAFAEPELDGCLLCKPAYLECLLKKGLNSSPFRDENLFAAIKSLIFSTESEENNDTVSTVGEIPLATIGTETSDKLSEPELESSIACMPIRNYLELNYCQLKGSSNTLDKSQLNFSASKNAAEGTDKVGNSSHEMQASCCSGIETLHGSVENFIQLNKKDSTTFMNDAWNHYWVPKQWVERWGDVFDIVTPDSKRCCCFTKSYGRYAKGTGSFLATKNLENLDLLYQILDRKHSQQECRSTLVDAFGLRYFTSREIANLHSFPPTFTFPKHISLKQRYALLGNSLSIRVVSTLLWYLFS